jgi:hypothetical protein
VGTKTPIQAQKKTEALRFDKALRFDATVSARAFSSDGT